MGVDGVLFTTAMRDTFQAMDRTAEGFLPLVMLQVTIVRAYSVVSLVPRLPPSQPHGLSCASGSPMWRSTCLCCLLLCLSEPHKNVLLHVGLPDARAKPWC